MRNFKITMAAICMLALTSASVNAQSIDTSRNYRIWNAFTNDGLTFAIRSFLGGGITFDTSVGNTLRSTRSGNYPGETWNLNSTGDGYYTITNTIISAQLNIDNQGSTAEGSRLANNTPNNSTSQQWKLTNAGGGNYIITNRASGLVITRDGRGSSFISQQRNTGSNLQKWFLQDAGPSVVITSPTPSESTNPNINITSISPNPAPRGTNVSVAVSSRVRGLATIQTFNLQNQLSATLTRNLRRGNNRFTLNSSRLRPGTYVLRITINGNVTTKRLIIR